MDKFTKQGYFIIYIKEILVKDVAKIYIKEVFLKYRLFKKNYIKQRYKIYINILASLYSQIRSQDSSVNSLLSTDRQINKEVKLNIGIILQILY